MPQNGCQNVTFFEGRSRGVPGVAPEAKMTPKWSQNGIKNETKINSKTNGKHIQHL